VGIYFRKPGNDSIITASSENAGERSTSFRTNTNLLKVQICREAKDSCYHDCLIEWRKMKKYLAYLNQQGENRFRAEVKLESYKTKNPGKITKERRDAEIFMDVMTGHL
jgi:hypothetical protein